jgi:hypothetical protein
MIERDPEIYSAVAKVLDSIERKYFYSSETEAKEWTLDDFKNTKIIVDTPGKSQRFQELLFSLGSKWGGFVFTSEDARKEVKHTNQKYLGIRDTGTLFYFTTEEEYKTYEDQPGIEMKEIFYDDIFPPLFLTQETETKEWTLDDFKDTKIIVDTPEKSTKFQELLRALGGLLYTGSKDIDFTSEPYLFIDKKGTIDFVSDDKNYFDRSTKKEIFYNDIFPEETQTKEWTIEDFKDSKIIVDTPEKSRKFQEFIIDLGARWSKVDVGDPYKRLSVNNTSKKYLIIRYNETSLKQYEIYFINDLDDFESTSDKEIFYDDIFPPLTTKKETKTKQWTLDDFKGTRILVSSEEKSRRFQELIFSLGGKWASGENKTPILLDVEFLIVDKQGDIGYTDATDFADSDYKQIFYANIFPKEHEKRVSTTYVSLKDFYKTKIEVNEKQSILLQEYLFSLGGKWFTGDRDLKWFNEKYLVIDQEGILTPVTKYNFDANPTYKSEYKRIYYSDIFRTDIERAFKDEPLEADFLTWPKPEIAKIYRIDKNKGDRKSPTQSAGELKDLFSDDESKTELFATYFKGNDGNWYRLYEDKNGTWRWSKQATPKQLK